MNQKIKTKVCTLCKKEKEITLFYKRKEYTDGLDCYCKECKNKKSREHYWNNIEANREYHRLYKLRNKEKRQKWILKDLYNLPIEKYNDMFIEQGGRCAICGKHQVEFKKKLCVDHNHETGKIRGLLCNKCNSLLGYAGESPDVLHNAVKYLIEQDIDEAKKLLKEK